MYIYTHLYVVYIIYILSILFICYTYVYMHVSVCSVYSLKNNNTDLALEEQNLVPDLVT